MKKILHITFDMTIGGAQQVIRQLIEGMDKTEFEHQIVCIDGTLGELGEILQEQGIKVHLLNRQEGFDYALIKQIRKLIKENQIHVLHCHQYTPYFYGVLAAIFTKAKVIFTEHGRFYPDYGTWKRKLVNPILNLFTYKITAISKATKAALVKYENFPENSIEVIYNGIADKSHIPVDKDKVKEEFNIPRHKTIFGTISRLQPIKNQQMMIRAFKMVHDEQSDTHLLIVGDGAIRSELETLTEELHIKDNVTFTGFQKDPFPFHHVIDIFLLSSFSEGTSMTLLEAMSLGKPAVVTDVGGNPELITDQENGFVVPSDEVGRIVESCMKFLKDLQLTAQLGSNSRNVYEDRFLVRYMLDAYLNIYQYLVQ